MQESQTADETKDIRRRGGRIATLGMFIIDTFKFFDDQGHQLPVEKDDQIGGGGTYFIIGARHFLPASELLQVIDTHPSSFSEDMMSALKHYGEEMFWFRTRKDGQPTARGLNVYTGQGRDFSMLSTGVRIWPEDLMQSPTGFKAIPPCIIHTTCSPERAAIIVQQIRDTQTRNTVPKWDPALIWEVLPSDCIPGKLSAISALCPHLAVLSPNHTEALAMFGMISSPYLSDHQVTAVYPTIESLKAAVEIVIHRLFKLIAKSDAPLINGGWDRGIIVRCGALGSCIARQRYGTHSCAEQHAELHWIGAYWTAEVTLDFKSHIVDVTGGGNAFLGGLAAGMKLTDGDLLQAAYYATISASFAIEQDGLPKLSKAPDGSEVWNSDNPEERLVNLKRLHPFRTCSCTLKSEDEDKR
ncbi:hypothetical protein NliqN6_3532 [Naganishia liquefaciens]|uniref:Carbohydrate kinase PfkB domain-containing protein n=1 Tax=Naganishia liquefaciens TaxID=104408 RepID=A0A8H3YEZ1_9TREE|nr:hypothetical protein NliqN6_3532 [Naganishia liquefaciens]